MELPGCFSCSQSAIFFPVEGAQDAFFSAMGGFVRDRGKDLAPTSGVAFFRRWSSSLLAAGPPPPPFSFSNGLDLRFFGFFSPFFLVL